jgi:hypothetical protein
MKRTESIKEYQKRYYLEKIKKKEKTREVVFEIKKFVDGKWVSVYLVTK